MKKILLSLFSLSLLFWSLAFGQRADWLVNNPTINPFTQEPQTNSQTTTTTQTSTPLNPLVVPSRAAITTNNPSTTPSIIPSSIQQAADKNTANTKTCESTEEFSYVENKCVPKWTIPVATSEEPVLGIKMGPTCLKNGTCSFSIYQFLGIRKSLDNTVPPSPTLFIQDIILAATTFIGTILTIVFIVSGLMFIFAGASGNDPKTATNGMKNSIIGLIIVICSYSIIRLVQYIAKGF